MTRRALVTALGASAAAAALLGACGGSSEPATIPTTRPVLTTRVILTTTTTEPVVQRRVYVVQPGDTLGAIAAGFGTSVEAIRTENALEDDILTIGAQLFIPPPTTTTTTTAPAE